MEIIYFETKVNTPLGEEYHYKEIYIPSMDCVLHQEVDNHYKGHTFPYELFENGDPLFDAKYIARGQVPPEHEECWVENFNVKRLNVDDNTIQNLLKTIKIKDNLEKNFMSELEKKLKNIKSIDLVEA